LFKFLNQFRGGRFHSEWMRARRQACESLGIFRYSVTGYWPFLQQYLPRKTGGTFLEAGAHDGWTGSNTYSLEAIWGWRGALVEPVPELHRQCCANRPRAKNFHAALVARDYPDPAITIEIAGLLSTVTDPTLLDRSRPAAESYYGKDYRPAQIQVPARTLDSLLIECGFASLDFLSLDVEGFEAQALRGLDFDRLAPRFILVEANYPDQVHAILDPRYRLLAATGPHDLLFTLR
jgi:FkbM family methyltransferase